MFLFTLFCGFFIPTVYFLYTCLFDRQEPEVIDAAPEQVYDVLRTFTLSPETLEIFKNADEEELLKIKDEISALPSWVDLGLLMEVATVVFHYACEVCAENEILCPANQWLQAFIFVKARASLYFEEEDRTYDLFVGSVEEFREAVLDDMGNITAALRVYIKGINPYRELGLLYFCRMYVQFGAPRAVGIVQYRKRINRMMKAIVHEDLEYREAARY
ncbi:hypothetical protein QR680_011194 [Steinernema hermaphroditum]|uniref:Uncharacterized protein n=1 Tax=Steinernema hermaphroditum TaxID=289476 RepID=A0AA39ISM4_9BILA|nr:hypothetical protein QR680_011194 [Steinernema hermaphroditum]